MSSRPSSKDIVTWAKILLKRKKIQRRFSAWARLYSVEPGTFGRFNRTLQRSRYTHGGCNLTQARYRQKSLNLVGVNSV
jgi:hypothetical protein